MSMLAAVIIPLVEKYLEAARPELTAFALHEIKSLSEALIDYVEGKAKAPSLEYKGEGHG